MKTSVAKDVKGMLLGEEVEDLHNPQSGEGNQKAQQSTKC